MAMTVDEPHRPIVADAPWSLARGPASDQSFMPL
jgi:hypothetical protein